MNRFTRWLLNTVACRDPDFIVGTVEKPYLYRWYVIPRNRFFNIYLHNFRRSDEDRALHDHMYFNCSILLYGAYYEHTIRAGGVNQRKLYKTGTIHFRTPWKAHRVELLPTIYGEGVLHAWTLFITGPRIRQWGFHCPQGWRHWKDFVAVTGTNRNEIGRGCE